jgi:hypothetical protein
MEEAASKLRISRRYLQGFLKNYPYYHSAGRKKLFTLEDINRLVEAMSCRGSSSRPAKAKRRTGTSEGSTLELLLTEVRALARSGRPPRSSSAGNVKPNVVNFANPPK